MEVRLSDMPARFGFKFGRGGAHLARTLMLDELILLLSYVENVDASRDIYVRAIVEDNCLAKRSGVARKLTANHLIDLYALDPATALFRSLRYFWKRDERGRPLLAFLCAYTRDPFLRKCSPFLLDTPTQQTISREDLEAFIEKLEPGRFSPATLKSTAQNVNGTWTKSGHLQGRSKKIRQQAQTTPGSVAYALLLGYINGARGRLMFETEYVKMLDVSPELAIELAQQASERGWIVVKKIGDVIEVLFPGLLTNEEMGWIHESN